MADIDKMERKVSDRRLDVEDCERAIQDVQESLLIARARLVKAERKLRKARLEQEGNANG